MKINKDWKFEETFPTIAAYTTSLNCVNREFPLAESVRSFSWATEIIVLDGGSDDGTVEMLKELQKEVPNLSIHEIPMSDEPGKDGEQKSLARALCVSDVLVQFDADEICMGNPMLWKKEAKNLKHDILNLFVEEPHGNLERIRVDRSHNPSKWRMSKNIAALSHGIPKHDQMEIDGKIYSKGLSDGAYPIHIVEGYVYPSYTPDYLVELLKVKDSLMRTTVDQDENKKLYRNKVKDIRATEPYILHLGHVDLEKKIKLYLELWHKWWGGLYNEDHSSPEGNVYFPGIAVSDVTEEMIKERVKELMEEVPAVIV